MSQEGNGKSIEVHDVPSSINSSLNLRHNCKLSTKVEINSTPQHNLDRNSWANERLLSPMTPKQKIIDILESLESNGNKNYMSKAEFCKGRSSFTKNTQFSNQTSNSPIVQYYVGLGQGRSSKGNTTGAIPSGEQINNFTLEEQVRKDQTPIIMNRDSSVSIGSQNFNFSPSNIFNKNNSSNTSLIFLNSPMGPNRVTGPSIGKVNTNECIIDSDGEEGKKNGDDSKSTVSNQDLYMLSFISDEENMRNSKPGNIEFRNSSYLPGNQELSENVDNHMPIQSAINRAMGKSLKSPKNREKNKRSPKVDHKDKKEKTQIQKDEIKENKETSIKDVEEKKELKSKSPEEENKKEDIKNETNTTNTKTLSSEISQISQSINNININLNINNNNPMPQQQLNQMNLMNPYYQNLMNNVYQQNMTKYPMVNQNSQMSFNSQTIQNTLNTSEGSIGNQSAGSKKKSKKIKRLDPSAYVNVPLEELASNIFILAKDQGGCRYLQKLLDEDPQGTTKVLYQPLIENILKLVNDPFGNYLIQKMFASMSQEQLHQIIYIFSPHFYDIGANPHGTRVLQQLINHLSSPFLIEFFLTVMTPYIVVLLKELNGTHVVQKFAFDYPQYAPFVNKIIVENSPSLATHRHGCCVIQKYLETSQGEMLRLLLEKLVNNCLLLIVDQFGNYVIQSILLMNNRECGNAIAMRITENVCYYAKHKYSSNVVEKCFDYCDGIVRQKLIFSLMRPEAVHDLILDEHGNYVIQKVLACVDQETQKIMLSQIVPLFDKLKMLNFGERIINRLLMSYPQMINCITFSNGPLMQNSLSLMRMKKNQNMMGNFENSYNNVYMNNNVDYGFNLNTQTSNVQEH